MIEATGNSDRNAALLAWYGRNARDLPWRTTSDPYRILIAEVMSQQTQAERVAKHFAEFVDRFPDVTALATAPFAAVAAAWSGLGYNTRAKRLHLAAKHISAVGWPTDYEGLLQLPGVGPYTAAAVACFAFDEARAAVDTNLRRVLSRWHGEPLSGAALRDAADRALADDAAAWNQAVMDLAATTCRPRNPGCGRCPVTQWCSGPEVYEPPRAQPRFEGSIRQARGAIVRRLTTGPASLLEMSHATGIPMARVEGALRGLLDDGVVAAASGREYRLAD